MKYRLLAGMCAAFLLAGSAAASAPQAMQQEHAADSAVSMKASTTDKKLITEKIPMEPLRDVDDSPLAEADFKAGGIAIGDPVSFAMAIKGIPEKSMNGSVHSEYMWPDMTVRIVNDLPYKYMQRKDLELPGSMKTPGIETIYFTAPGISTNRGISVGSRRENVVRVYGVPANMLWDGPNNCFYAVYEKGGYMLIFTLTDDKVKAIRLTDQDSGFLPVISDRRSRGLSRFRSEDFRIAGYGIGESFHEHSWMVWQKKAVTPEEEVWYYPGFGLRMDAKTKVLSALFLTDNHMMTNRGAAIGDQMSTVEALYGAPQKVEMTELEGHPQAAYIYFSRDRREVLIFYIDETEKVVRRIMVMRNPQIPNLFEPALERIRQVRIENREKSEG